MTKLRYILILILLPFTATGCTRTPDEISTEINRLKGVEQELEGSISSLQQQQRQLEEQVQTKRGRVQELDNRLVIGDDPLYVLTLKVKKESLSLSLTQHAKDEMNAFEFDIPVDKALYDNVRVGQELNSASLGGSLIFGGTLGSVTITITEKQLQRRPVS